MAQALHLHEEASYARMDEVESQLCRRLFWILFTGDKYNGILGKHQITLGRYLIESGITVHYSSSLESEDVVMSSHSGEDFPRLITGFNLNQELYRAVYQVILETDATQTRYHISEHEFEEPPNQIKAFHLPTPDELYQLLRLWNRNLETP